MSSSRAESGDATAISRGDRVPSMLPSARLLVGVALVPVAVLLVHEIRYLLAFGGGTDSALAERGHGYFAQLLAPLALTIAVALGAFLARLGHAWRTGAGERPSGRTLATLWLLAAAGLLAIYAGQELLEAAIAQGRPPGLGPVFGDGGLWAVPASILLGLLLALVLRGAARAVDLAARLGRRRRWPRAAGLRVGAARPARTPALDPMALSAPGRAPPRSPFLHFAGFSG